MIEAPRDGMPATLILIQFEGDPDPICADWHSTMFGWVHDTGHGSFRIMHNPIGWLPLLRLVANRPTGHVIGADTLDELRAKLPSGLIHSPRSPSDASDVLEVWFLP